MLWTRTFLLYSGTQFKVNFSRSSYNTNPHSKLACDPHSKFACGGSTCILHSLVPLVLLTPSDPALLMVSENGIPTLGLKGAFRGLGLASFHTVQSLVQTSAEDLSLVQFELYRGGVQILHPP